MAGEAARERKCIRARTPNRPSASSIGREPSLSLGSWAERRRARLGRHETGKGGDFTPCECGRTRAWVHGYANRMYDARMRTPAP
jgi:hypothetical protein